MEKKEANIIIPEGTFNVNCFFYNNNDLRTLAEIYTSWVNLSNLTQNFGGRRINIPEILSEVIYCIHFNAIRLADSIGQANTSFDCYNPNNKKRVQIKASSVENDLTSFGPRSVWDELVFIHFFPTKKYDGSYDIYKIESELIYKHKVNKHQTFIDQQKEGKRPRFSLMKELIKPNKIKPFLRSKLDIL